MPLLNYTTSIAADKTAGEIQKMLAKAGADQIMANQRRIDAAKNGAIL